MLFRSLRELGVDEIALKEITDAGNGGAISDPRDVFQKDRHRFKVAVEIWTWVVAFSALFFLLEIALRRLHPGFLSKPWGERLSHLRLRNRQR